MSRWKGESYVLHVHRDRVVISRQGEMQPELIAECPFKDGAPVRAAETCINQLPQKSASVEIVLDDSYARYWQVTPPLHATRLADLQAAARMRFESLFDLPADEWSIEAAWHAKKEFWACALPAALVNNLDQVLRSGPKIRILGCYPHFIQQWNQVAGLTGRGTEGFAVVGDCAITLALISDASLISVRILPFDTLEPASLQAIDSVVHSLSMQLGIDAPQEVLVAGGIHLFDRKGTSHGAARYQVKPARLSPTRRPSASEEPA